MTMTHSVDWNMVRLRQNPFLIIPPRNPSDAVWAGLPRLKAQFETLFTEALTSSVTQVVLNWGTYGSGKTHAAVYFGAREHLPQVEGRQLQNVRILCVRTPKDPTQADKILYRDVVEAIRFSTLREVVRGIIVEYGENESLSMLQDAVSSEALGKALWLLGLERESSGQLRLLGEDEFSSEWHRLLEAYFFSEYTKTDLRRLGLSRGIDNAQDRFRVLGGMLQCLIGLVPVQAVDHHSRVILWIDEIEDLIYYTSRQYRPFTQGLRDLVDRLPAHFTLLMNIVLAAPEAFEDAAVVLGDALMNRVTHQIYFQEPEEEEAYEFICDLLRQYRTDDPISQALPKTYPFEEDALRLIVSTLPSRTPRDLNQRCNEIVTKALQRGIIVTPGNEYITSEFVSELEQERIDLDFG